MTIMTTALLCVAVTHRLNNTTFIGSYSKVSVSGFWYDFTKRCKYITSVGFKVITTVNKTTSPESPNKKAHTKYPLSRIRTPTFAS